MSVQIERPTYTKDKPVVEQRPLLKRLHWVHVVILSITPLLALYGFFTTPILPKTLAFAIVYYVFSGIGITAGYHRLWAHCCYSARHPLQVFLAIAGSAAVQGSIFWWCRDHRVHHRYTDTSKDPYNAKKGLYHSHIGWMLVIKDRRQLGYADTSDLKSDALVRWQHKYYPILSFFTAIVVPTVICGLFWGDWRGGYFYAAISRIVAIHHATFCINSLAHALGETSYDDEQTSRDSFVTAFVTLGEGYHNFHHQFPNDYRNAILYYQYDPTKWFIVAAKWLNLAYDLKTFPANEIKKGQLDMRLKAIKREQASINYGPPIEKLPVITRQEFLDQVKINSKKWMALEGCVYDVENFMTDHPGGKNLLQSGIGKDMTEAFNGGVYKHHNAARNLLWTMRVGRLDTV